MSVIKLGTNLKRLLAEKRLSLKRVSGDTGIPYSTLHTWLENRQPKDIVKVKALADYLKTDLSCLLFGTGESPPATGSLVLPLTDGIEGEYEIIVRRRRN